MATHRALAAASAALLGLIGERYPRADFGPALELQLYQAKDFESPMNEGFSIFAYRLTVNGNVRNLGHRRAGDGTRFKPSLPLDLHLLLTPWSQDAERQLRMLGWAMRFVEDLGILGAGQLNHHIAETDTFRADETVELIADPLALADYLNVWDKWKNKMPTSMTYVARVLTLDSEIATDEGALVQTRRFDRGQAVPS
jgi:hypothetical protein